MVLQNHSKPYGNTYGSPYSDVVTLTVSLTVTRYSGTQSRDAGVSFGVSREFRLQSYKYLEVGGLGKPIVHRVITD